jgi:hypothetical protein
MSTPIEDRESALINVDELQHQLTKSLQKLSPERLEVVADLANTESEAATQEFLSIPERFLDC